MQYFGNALFLHCNAVKYIRRLHRTATVRDDDKLRFQGKSAQIRCEPLHITVIQRRVDLVQHAKRRRTDLQNCKIQRNGNKCFFTAGKERDGFQLFSGRLHTDINAAAQRISGVLQFQ